MAKFSDTLKKFGQGTGQWLTLEGRNLAQLYKNLELASKVKRVKPEDYSSSTEYKAALKKSQEANKKLQSELINPSANAALNRILNISPEQQSRQSASQLYGMTKENPRGTTFSPELFKTSANLLSKLPIAGGGLAATLAIGGAQGGAGGFGMSDPGKELENTLLGTGLGVAGGAAAYGLSKLGQSLLNKTRVRPSKTAGKQATLDWGFKEKDIVKVGGWEEAQKIATDLYSDAKTLGRPTKNRYDKANALKGIVETLNADSDILVSAFDKSGTPAASVNQVINSIKTNPKISLALTKDPATAEWLYQTISSYADDAGNLSMAAIKEAMSTIQSTAGGFKGVMGDQGPYTKQILASGRSVLRDAISDVSPEISRVMGKLFDYINIEPSVLGQVVKKGKIPLPGTLSGINLGTVGAEVSDAIGGFLSFSGKGRQGSVTTPYKGIGNVLETIGLVGQQIPKGIVGGLMGGTPEEELGDDDEGIQMIRSAFGQSGSMQPKGLRMAGLPEQGSTEQSSNGIDSEGINALNFVLAQEVLNGNISAEGAKAVLSLLGMEQTPTGSKLPAGSLAELAQVQESLDLLPTLSGLVTESSSAFGPVEGQIRSRIPWDKTGQKAKTTIQLVKQIIGKGLEGGVLRKEDEYKYENILPKLGDTESTVTTKIQLLQDVLSNKYNTLIQTYEAGGYNPTYGSY